MTSTLERKMMTTHADEFLNEVQIICATIDVQAIEKLADALAALRTGGGRLFLLGVGGSAGNCSHAVNDFRKLCGIEAYTPVDNVSELTARTNDEGFDTIFTGWLEISRISNKDALLIYSVGGGDAERNVSVNLMRAIDLAKERGAKVFGIVGRDNGYTAKKGDIVVVIPQVNPARVTPLSEGMQGIVWHCLVSHPDLQVRKTKW
jgi:D-sedoheptulose 7-phosphate isomerase